MYIYIEDTSKENRGTVSSARWNIQFGFSTIWIAGIRTLSCFVRPVPLDKKRGDSVRVGDFLRGKGHPQ